MMNNKDSEIASCSVDNESSVVPQNKIEQAPPSKTRPQNVKDKLLQKKMKQRNPLQIIKCREDIRFMKINITAW
jgi:hypothetical protein